MPTINVYDQKGIELEKIELDDSIFGIEPNAHVMHEAVVNYLANQRQGTFAARTRSERRGGGRKPFRQKGTGRARQGSIRAPHYVGGGVVFAKKPRDFSYRLPKKIKRLAFKSALSDKVLQDELYVVNELKLDQAKTREFAQILKDTQAPKKTLLVISERDEKVLRASSNIKGVQICYPNTINTYAVINCDRLMLTKDALNKITEVYK